MHKQQGTSLLEGLVVVTISSILVSAAIPAMGEFLLRAKSRASEVQLMAMLGAARSQALHLGWPATLCPLDSNGRCSTDWSADLSLFIDHNDNSALDAQDQFLRSWQADWGNASLSWVRGRKRVIFRPNGSSTASTGSLRYCSLEHEKFDFRVVVARTGRYRLDRKTAGCD